MHLDVDFFLLQRGSIVLGILLFAPLFCDHVLGLMVFKREINQCIMIPPSLASSLARGRQVWLLGGITEHNISEHTNISIQMGEKEKTQ